MLFSEFLNFLFIFKAPLPPHYSNSDFLFWELLKNFISISHNKLSLFTFPLDSILFPFLICHRSWTLNKRLSAMWHQSPIYNKSLIRLCLDQFHRSRSSIRVKVKPSLLTHGVIPVMQIWNPLHLVDELILKQVGPCHDHQKPGGELKPVSPKEPRVIEVHRNMLPGSIDKHWVLHGVQYVLTLAHLLGLFLIVWRLEQSIDNGVFYAFPICTEEHLKEVGSGY